MGADVAFAPGAPAWVDLVTSDPAGARAFYGTLFDWEFDIGGPETGLYTYCLRNGARAAGMVGQAVATMPPAWTTYLATDDADATAQRMTTAGAALLLGPADAGPAGRVVVATDPTGATVGAWQPGEHPGAAVTSGPGAVIWSELATDDLDTAAAFYADVFGHDWQATTRPDAGAPQRTFSARGSLAGGAVAVSGTSAWRPYFGVGDLDGALSTVRRLDGTVVSGPTSSPYGALAQVADPQGAALSLLEQAA